MGEMRLYFFVENNEQKFMFVIKTCQIKLNTPKKKILDISYFRDRIFLGPFIHFLHKNSIFFRPEMLKGS